MNRFVDDQFVDTESTLSMGYRSHCIESSGNRINLRIWDTAGQERFRSITRSYYYNAAGVMIVFDLTDLHSFEETVYWIKSVKENVKQDISILLIGNKNDLSYKRKVSKEVAEEFAKENNILYIETSAKKSENVADAFKLLVNQIITRFSLYNYNLEQPFYGVLRGTSILQTGLRSSDEKTKSQCRKQC
ncbi:ras and ef-hand domain-containing protein [Anaeramoeba flamelloides]|uniref:Ras and ef-hand domain-containing protein n=1 Tax=Anaeramoeba flamelloides TaxID=1746091 RepID=A0AAV7ZLG6_9EUKA|nr:ras and ef-hand domain-containing protein [Anaeramoeba flamelloides]KAJ6239703.1 ras and ef-hand domain-containing protein [Anaeramoeba flamelloides]